MSHAKKNRTRTKSLCDFVDLRSTSTQALLNGSSISAIVFQMAATRPPTSKNDGKKSAGGDGDGAGGGGGSAGRNGPFPYSVLIYCLALGLIMGIVIALICNNKMWRAIVSSSSLPGSFGSYFGGR